MDPNTKFILEKIANQIDFEGFESCVNLTNSDHEDLDHGLSDAINTAEGFKFNELIQLRFLFRVLAKYGSDIERGLSVLTKYCTNDGETTE